MKKKSIIALELICCIACLGRTLSDRSNAVADCNA